MATSLPSLQAAILDEWQKLGMGPTSAHEVEQSVKIIQTFSPIILKLAEDLQNIPERMTYRVVEFGCGHNPEAFLIVFAVVAIFKKTLSYVGIDNSAECIKYMNRSKTQQPEAIRRSCQFIHADGSKFDDWSKQLSVKSRFDAAVFMRPPALGDPYDTFGEYFKKNGIEKDEGADRGRVIHRQYLVMFDAVLRKCLFPNGTIMIQLDGSDEYPHLLKILPTITAPDLPNLPQEVPDGFCLAVTHKPPEGLIESQLDEDVYHPGGLYNCSVQ